MEGTQTSLQEEPAEVEVATHIKQASWGIHRQTPSDLDQHCLASGPHPSPKRVSGILPGWAFIPFNREIGK